MPYELAYQREMRARAARRAQPTGEVRTDLSPVLTVQAQDPDREDAVVVDQTGWPIIGFAVIGDMTTGGMVT